MIGIHVPVDSYDDWMEKRKAGLGASDVAAIFRLSKWTSPYSLWAEKTGQLPPTPPTDAMLVGRAIGPAIMDLWELRSGLWALRRDALFRHPDISWALASPDALIYERPNQILGDGEPFDQLGEPLGVLEVKNEFAEWDEVPWQYQIQVCWQQFVTGIHEPGTIVNLTARKNMQIFDVEYDPDLAANLLQGAQNFWDLVVAGNPPPIDDSESTSEALASLFPPGSAGGVCDLDELADLVEQLRSVKLERARIDKDIKGWENEIKAAMGDADIGLIDGQEAVTWKAQSRGAYSVAETSFRVLRLKGVKE